MTVTTPVPFPKPPPGSPYATMWIAELDEAQRQALPAEYHRPFFDGLGTPQSWACEVCWGDGWTTGWPCSAALAGGAQLAESLGVGYSS